MTPEFNKLLLSRYIISRHIASGGMADVYEAQDIVKNKTVALKFLKDKSLYNDFEIEQFKDEARFLAAFNHPHIMKIYNVGEYNGVPFQSFELIKGKTLKEVLDNRGKLSFDEAVDYLLQIVDAVSNMHEKEILHNDIKPDNLFLLSDGNIKICDFGIVTHANSKEQKELHGTVKYLAPEVVQYHKQSYQSDIYSLGIVFFEFLTGKVPFDIDVPKTLIETYYSSDFPSLKKYISLPNIDDLDYVISKACNRNLTLRYKTVKEFANDLNAIKRHEKIKKGSFLSRLLSR